MSAFSIIKNPSEALWNETIAGLEKTVFTDDYPWKKVVEETYGHQPFYYIIKKNLQPVGLLAAFLVKSTWFGKYLVTAPYGNNGGCYFPEENEAKVLVLETSKKIAVENRLDYVELRNVIPLNYGLLNPDLSYSNFHIELDPDPKVVMDRLRGSTRRDIIKAQKAGFQVCIGKEHLPLMFNVLHKNMQRLGSPFHGIRYFENILKYLEAKVEIIVILKNSHPVSGALLVAHKNAICNLYSATLQEYNHYALNSLLYWEIIHFGCENSFRYFEMGRSHLNQGTYDFKRRWGGKIIPLHYEYVLFKRKKIPYLNPANKNFRLAIEVWKKLPVPLTTFLGSRIIGDIA